MLRGAGGSPSFQALLLLWVLPPVGNSDVSFWGNGSCKEIFVQLRRLLLPSSNFLPSLSLVYEENIKSLPALKLVLVML